jgi:hypothetical protein
MDVRLARYRAPLWPWLHTRTPHKLAGRRALLVCRRPAIGQREEEMKNVEIFPKKVMKNVDQYFHKIVQLFPKQYWFNFWLYVQLIIMRWVG